MNPILVTELLTYAPLFLPISPPHVPYFPRAVIALHGAADIVGG